MKIIRKVKKGSILLEALLSVVILSVSLTLIIETMTSSLRAIVYSSDYTSALIALDNKMISFIQKEWMDASSDDQDSTDDKNLFKAAVVSSSGENNLLEASGKVAWNSKGKNNQIAVDTYIFKPTP